MSGTEIETRFVTDDDFIYKIMYLARKNANTCWDGINKDWGVAVNQFAILFDGRVSLFLATAI